MASCIRPKSDRKRLRISKFRCTLVKESDILTDPSSAPINQPLDDDEPNQVDFAASGTAPVAPEPNFLAIFGNFVESKPSSRDLESGSRLKLTPISLRQTLETLSTQINVKFDRPTASEEPPSPYLHHNRFTWANPYTYCTMTKVADMLRNHIGPVFGYLKAVHTDNGYHFTGKAINDLLEAHGVLHFLAPVTHPSSVGLVERNVQPAHI